MFDEECEFIGNEDWCICHKCLCQDKKDCYFKRLDESEERIKELEGTIEDLEDDIRDNEEEIDNLNGEVGDLEYQIEHSLDVGTSSELESYILELDSDINLSIRKHNRTLEEVCYDLEKIIKNS